MLQTPSRRVLWKITSTARKSMNEIRNAPPRSSVNDMRYWSCERICAPTSRRQTRTESTTLHDQLPRTEAQRDPAQPEQHERERVERRGVVEAEEKAADQERENAAEDEVERGASEVEREPVPLRVERAREVGGDRPVADPQRQLVPAEDVNGHDQRLREPDVGHRVGRVVAPDVCAVTEHSQQDVGLDEAEDRVREHSGGRRPRV